MEKLVVREATAQDATQLAAILTDATARKVAYNDSSWGSEEWSAEEVQHLMKSSPTYLAYVNEVLAGTVSLQWEADDNWKQYPGSAAYIHRLAVTRAFAGRGLGRQIVNWADSEATNRNRKLLRLDCSTSNGDLCAYYEHLGFKQVASFQTTNPEYIAALFERPVR